jgi:hypothetical protein
LCTTGYKRLAEGGHEVLLLAFGILALDEGRLFGCGRLKEGERIAERKRIEGK